MQSLEHAASAASQIFAFESVEHLVEQGGGPLAFVNLRGVHFHGGFPSDLTFGCRRVQRSDGLRAATFRRVEPVALVGQEIFETTEQEGAELYSSAPFDSAGQILRQEMNEEILRGVLGVGMSETETFGVGKDGWPISFAETGQRFLRMRVAMLPSA